MTMASASDTCIRAWYSLLSPSKREPLRLDGTVDEVMFKALFIMHTWVAHSFHMTLYLTWFKIHYWDSPTPIRINAQRNWIGLALRSQGTIQRTEVQQRKRKGSSYSEMHESYRQHRRTIDPANEHEITLPFHHVHDRQCGSCTSISLSIHLPWPETIPESREDSFDDGHFEKSQWVLGVGEANIPWNWDHCARTIIFGKGYSCWAWGRWVVSPRSTVF